MYVDVWSIVARHEREIDSIKKLWKLGLIGRSLDLVLLVAMYEVSNAALKPLLKAKVRIESLLWSLHK